MEILLGRLEHDVLNKDPKTNPNHFLYLRLNIINVFTNRDSKNYKLL